MLGIKVFGLVDGTAQGPLAIIALVVIVIAVAAMFKIPRGRF
jgi:hypothetical protein